MLKNYFKTAWRNLLKSKGYSAINIGGLAVGMAVAMLIGLWIWDELSYNKYFKNYDSIAQVMQHQTFNGVVNTQVSNPAVTAGAIRSKYGSNFKHVVQASWNSGHTLAYGEKKFSKTGTFFEPEAAEMFSLDMITGTRSGLKEPYSILLSQSVAEALFGAADPLNKVIRMDNKANLKVTGVYKDFPYSTSFKDITYLLPWELYLIQNPWIKEMEDPWGSNFTQTYAQIAGNADMEVVSAKIKNVKFDNLEEAGKRYKPTMFLHPMRKWHLHAAFKDGINTGGRIEYVWLFGIVGVFVLLLACINFMNLSTARSEGRAREVGVRKAIGSMRRQLVLQFFSESYLIVLLAFMLALLLVLLALPFFNQVADKRLSVLWASPVFWMLGGGVCLITGLLAGSYPALYLSSFQPVKVLKGTFRAGRNASLPRQVMVVVQFSVSVILVIGTIIVYQQIQHAKNRPIGYSRESMVYVEQNDVIWNKYEALRQELKSKGVIVDMAQSTSPATGVWNSNGGFDWEGKDPTLGVDFPNNGVSYEYGKVIGWTIKEGRDFSRDFATDSSAFILNESAVKFIGLKDPVGKIIKWNDQPYTIVGVVNDMLVESPYEPVRASLFHIAREQEGIVQLRINPALPPADALAKIEATFKKFDPASVFKFQFVDEDFAKKFDEEQRIGRLATGFAVLAIFISCLGLFGLASFVAEQRTKEIGIRKVLGATVANLWHMLSKQFVWLVGVSLFIALPAAYFFMRSWLQHYTYRTGLPWWVFVAAAAGALAITLLTVSFQAIKAAIQNPVKSLRTE